MEAFRFANPDRDNFGEDFGQLNYDFTWVEYTTDGISWKKLGAGASQYRRLTARKRTAENSNG